MPAPPPRSAPPEGVVPEVIEGVRVRLRRSTPDDARVLHRIASDPEVMRYLEWPAAGDEDQTWRFLAGAAARWATGQEHHWVIVAKERGEVVGSVATRRRGHAADVGVILGREHGGRGLGREALGLLVGWWLRQPGLHRVWAAPDADDWRSCRMLEQLGFRCEGRLGLATVRPAIGLQPRDALLYAKLAAPSAS
jgi:RimJ/RimL family protein N-acetyltransferase